MTVHTIRLEDQGIERPSVRSYRVYEPGPRCEHEVRRNGVIRQCRATPVMTVGGRSLCARHGRSVNAYPP